MVGQCCKSYLIKTLDLLLVHQDVILNTDDDSGCDCYLICHIDYNDICKEKTEQRALMPLET